MTILKSDSLNKPPSILLVDDDRLVLSSLNIGLTRAGYKVNTVESVDEAEAWLDENERPDLAIIDMKMPERNGLELTKRLEELNQIPFILLSAYSEQEIIAKAIELGTMVYLVKPVETSQLIPVIETTLSRARDIQVLRGDNEKLQTALDRDRSINIAVGIIMIHKGICREDALNQIRTSARSNHMSLITLASNIVKSFETLNL